MTIIISAVGIFVYQRFGGVEGARYWMAARALNRVEKHVLQNRPDGVSEADVHSQFEKIRQENAEGRTDLIRLDWVLRDYLTKFRSTKPSTQEAIEFLDHLESTVQREEKE